ncbi:MAG: SpoIIE family protein phosphatase [Desulfobacteraceae bacterium]|nr:SpoIIE family protein phosphatase [Desulfobacteraceae bacterium]
MLMKTASVKNKLMLSFMGVASFVVLSSALAFYTFVFLGQTMDRITKDRLPPMVLAQRLAAQSERIIGNAPLLISSVKDDERKAILDAIRTDVGVISQLISEIREFPGSVQMVAVIESDFTQMVKYLRQIDEAVKRKLELIKDSRRIYNELLGTHREFQAIIKPAISISKQPIDEQEEFAEEYGRENMDMDLVRSLPEAVEQLMPLLEIERLGNALTNLLLSSATEHNLRNLRIIRLKGRALISDIKEQTGRLKAEMAGAYAELMILFKPYTVGKLALPELRRQELETTAEAYELLEKSRALSNKMNGTVKELIGKANADIHQATLSAKETRRFMSVILGCVALASLVFSVFMGWVYVGKQVIQPINRVVYLIRKVAEGDLSAPLDQLRPDRNRKDEIGIMTNNLVQLIDVTSETARVAEEIAGGNLGLEVRERSDRDRMMKALNRMIRRLNGIMDETNGMIRAVGQGRLDVRGNAGAFDGGWRDLVLGVNDLIDGLGKAVARSAALGHEMKLARKIQTSLLPTSFNNLHPDFEISASMVTANQVGGDYYDITSDRQGHLWISIGDVSGHGVTSGLIMMMAQTVHKTITTSTDCDAREAVIMVNNILYRNVHERLNETHFMTFNALKYQGNGRFEHAGAHLRIIVYRGFSGRCELIRTKGIYLNLKKDITRSTGNSYFDLEKGDVMVLYSDGLTEAENPEGELLDINGFMEIIGLHVFHDPETMKKKIMADVLRWSRDRIDDDMTLVIVKPKGSTDE